MEKRIIDKWEAIVQFDTDENKHVIAFNGVGGAIVSDEILTEAERKFVEAMKLTEDVGDVLKLNK